MVSIIKKIVISVGSFLTLWLFGFVYFALTLEQNPTNDGQIADGIVVLTGGKGRIEMGVSLLNQGLGKRLFISGVHAGVTVHDLAHKQELPINLRPLLQNSQLGYKAQNTAQNAIEAASWVKNNNIHSIRLVTADYHVKRSRMEFARLMPDVIVMVHPVKTIDHFNEVTLKRLWSEYFKLCRSLLRTSKPTIGLENE